MVGTQNGHTLSNSAIQCRYDYTDCEELRLFEKVNRIERMSSDLLLSKYSNTLTSKQHR